MFTILISKARCVLNFKEKVATNIKYYRKLAGMTLKEVAEKCDMTEANLQKYESGNMKSLDIDTTYKIAEALGVRPEDLTGWKIESTGNIYIDAGRELTSRLMMNQATREAVLKFIDLSEADRDMVIGLIDRLYDNQAN